ncbi:MAG: WG repeat-containing protein [Flavobacteriales bacterium]|nr:WG repeat-containing protein [Flavobacteriales bacterium]
MKFRILIVLFATLFVASAFSGKVKKGMQALDIYNYFEAKRLFEKAEKKHPVAASYGLSIIYQRTDNPFSNLDSAFSKILRSVDQYSSLSIKKKDKYRKFGIDSLQIVQQRNLISELMYNRTKEENTVASFTNFIQEHPWSQNKSEAIYKRDSIAFDIAVTEGKSKGYEQFLKDYPESEFSKVAKTSYDKLLYVENTASDNFVDYLNFLDKYPESPYRTDAEDKIFKISTRAESAEAYERFIQDFPTNHNVELAWRRLFNAFLQKGYSVDNLEEFKRRFPDYPFTDELERELELANISFYPVKEGDKWGYTDLEQNYFIPLEFEEVNWFYEGLAVVKREDLYGYIDKMGKFTIDPAFDDALDFNEGHAVVEQSEKYGMINRNGEFTIPAVYEDLGNLEDGLAYFQNEEELYGYFDEKGIERLKAQFTDAYDFENGRAIVAKNDYYGLIDRFGTTFMAFKYEDLRPYREDIYKAKLRGNWGLVNLQGDTLAPFYYDYIGNMYNERALVERGGEFNYIDAKGNVLLNEWIPVYDEFRELAKFRSGYAKIKLDDAYNLIDTTGKKLYPRNQSNLGDYGDLIAVKKGMHWGYLTPKGAMVIPNSFSMAKSFRGDYGIAGEEPLWGVINKRGKYVVEPYFEELKFLNDSLIIAKSRSNYGLLTTAGDTLLNFSYISIEPINEFVVKLERGGDLYYYHLPKNSFIRKEED